MVKVDAIPMIANCMRLQEDLPAACDHTVAWCEEFLIDTGEGRRPVMVIKVDVYLGDW